MPKITPRPLTLTTGLLLYTLLDLALVGSAATALFGPSFAGEGQATAAAIAGVLGATAVAVGLETWRAWRGKRSARISLMYVSTVLLLLVVWRRLALFIILALLGAVAAVFLWMPASNRFYQSTEPRRQRLRKYANASSRAAGVWRRKP